MNSDKTNFSNPKQFEFHVTFLPAPPKYFLSLTSVAPQTSKPPVGNLGVEMEIANNGRKHLDITGWVAAKASGHRIVNCISSGARTDCDCFAGGERFITISGFRDRTDGPE